MFRSCGESEVGDAVRVVAGQVNVVAVADFVVVHVVVEVAVDDGAELEDDFGAVGGPPRSGNSEAVFDDEPACSLDHSGGDRPAGGEGLVIVHVRVVVRQVGDCPVDVGEVQVAGGGLGAGPGGDGRQGGGDCFGAAVQHPQPLPVGPFACGLRVA